MLEVNGTVSPGGTVCTKCKKVHKRCWKCQQWHSCGVMCYNCNKKGHLSRCCRAPRKPREVFKDAGKEASENVTETVRPEVVAFSLQAQVPIATEYIIKG